MAGSWVIENTGAVFSDGVTYPSGAYIGFDSDDEAHVGYLSYDYGSSAWSMMHVWKHDGAWQTPETVDTLPVYLGSIVPHYFAAKGDALIWAWTKTIHYASPNRETVELWIATATVGGSWTTTKISEWVTHDHIIFGSHYWNRFGSGGVGVDLDSSGDWHIVTFVSDISNREGWLNRIYYFKSGSSTVIYEDTYSGYLFTNEGGKCVYVDALDQVHAAWWYLNLEGAGTAAWEALGYACSGTGWTIENVDQTFGDEDGYLYYYHYLVSITADASGNPYIIFRREDGTESPAVTTAYFTGKPWTLSNTLPFLVYNTGFQIFGSAPKSAQETDNSSRIVLWMTWAGGAWTSNMLGGTNQVGNTDLAIVPSTGVPWIAFDGNCGDNYGVYVANPGPQRTSWMLM